MDYRLYKKEDFHTGKWQGGETTELAIFPQNAHYSDRDFIWRLSSASIETEESDFTFLPDYDRVLMVLEGEVILAYEGERVSRLKEFEQDSFDGAFKTRSFGQITDYNLMVRKGSRGFLSMISPTDEKTTLDTEKYDEYQHTAQCFFCCQGYAVVTAGGKEMMLKEGEQLVLEIPGRSGSKPARSGSKPGREPGDEPESEPGADPGGETVSIGIMGEGKVIHAQIFYNDQVLGPEKIPPQKATFADFLASAKIAYTSFRGSQYIFKKLQTVWYDEELQKGINKIERVFLPFIVFFAGILGVTLGAEMIWGKETLLASIVTWIAADLLVVTPLIYFAALPKPVKAHIKKIENLSDYEREVFIRQNKDNPRLEKLLKKYKRSGRDFPEDS